MSEFDNEMLKLVAQRTLGARYVPEFAKHESPEHLNEALGVAIANYADWSGKPIIQIFLSALEDANYHQLHQIVLDYAVENGLAD